MLRNTVKINGLNIYPFNSFEDLLEYVSGKKGILVAINAEKILHATDQTRNIINRNIGYCDGIGAVMALKKHGYKDVVKIPGCELWLKIIASTYKEGKTFYLVGSKQEVIEDTVSDTLISIFLDFTRRIWSRRTVCLKLFVSTLNCTVGAVRPVMIPWLPFKL